jgi:hypothetical protein
MRNTILFFSIILISCNVSKKMNNKISTIRSFREFIIGNFNNDKQVAEEIANGKQIHPKAKHINRFIDDKIEGLILGNVVNDAWVLEESYYEYPNKPVEVKPYLFHFTEGNNNTVLLEVYQFPNNLKKEEITNTNPNLKFKFSDLQLSSTFKGATYTYDKEKKVFTTKSVNDLGNGMTFTLTETLSATKLIVMELLEKEGKKLTPYDTPIIYDRK